MKKSTPYTKCTFLKSAAKLSQLPDDLGAEVAFVGRSNAGKSSALNVITQQKQLAKISKTPGRTQLINVFTFQENQRLIDLPGYGYAKVSDSLQKEWQVLLQSYLIERRCLAGLILLMDCRHPLKAMDNQMIYWANHSDVPIHVLLTKSDKLSFGAAKNTLLMVQRVCRDKPKTSVQLFSAKTRLGLEDAYTCLDGWFGSAINDPDPESTHKE